MFKYFIQSFALVLILYSSPSLWATPSTSDLPDSYYENWLAQVGPLLTNDERDIFGQLERDNQREAFIEAFWRSRDEDPETPFNGWRERYERQVQEAWNSHHDLRDERAQMMLLHGPPRYTHLLRCPLLKPLHILYFPRTRYREQAFTALFVVRQSEDHGFELWPAERKHGRLVRDYEISGLALPEMLDRVAEAGCFTGQEQLRGFLEGALEEGVDWKTAQQRANLPAVDEDWLPTFRAGLEEPRRAEATIGSSLQIVFPARDGPRTILQGLLRLPLSSVQPWLGTGEVGRPATELASSFLLTGYLEFLDAPKEDERVIPHQFFRQRFHLTDSQVKMSPESEYQALYFYRDLVPGTYSLTLRLQDPDGKTLLRDYRTLEVPAEVTAQVEPLVEGAVEITPENLALLANRPTVQIVSPPGLQVGPTVIDLVTSGRGIAAIHYALDGTLTGVVKEPPWELEIDLGPEPRPHTLQVSAVNGVGNILANDALRLNAGAHHFAVRLLEPTIGEQYQGVLRARAAVEVPASGSLERVEFFLEENLAATLYQPPFIQMLALDPSQEATYVKAVAHLTDGSSTSDLVLVNLPGEVDEIDVREIELYANVYDRRKRPVNDLEATNFEVYEEGVEQEILRLERVEDLPVHVALLIDSSSSMVDELPLAISSAMQFFDTVLTPEDQASVISFNERTRLSVPFTRDLDWLGDGVSTLSARGGTAIWDGVISSLHYFGGLKGKRAMVLLSDGDDQHSRFRFDNTRYFAQRAGVAIYTITLDVAWEAPANSLPSLNNGGDLTIDPGTGAWDTRRKRHRRRLERLAKESGGLFFKIASTKTLDRAFRAIEEDMRTQYLITYQSSHQGDDFRSVELKTEPGNLKVRTIGGYYP